MSGLLSGALLGLAVAPSLAADSAIIILDASGSMWGQIGGRPKQEIARESLRSVLQSLPGDRAVGLMAYGHRVKDSCQDIELIVPPARGTASAIVGAADRLTFLGKTPLTAAVRKAAQDLDYTKEKATVVLITDGVESCDADPCALAEELEAGGADFTVHVLGFGLTAEEGSRVACLAGSTGGKYLQASDAGQLSAALGQAVAAEPQPAAAQQVEPMRPAERAAAQAMLPAFNLVPTLKMAENTPPLDGRAGQTWTVYRAQPDGSRGAYVSTEYGDWKGNLEPGDYVLIARLGRAEASQRLTVEAGKTAEPVVVLNAGTLKVRPVAVPGQKADPNAVVRFDYPGGRATGYGESSIVLPAGVQTITVRVGKAEASEKLRLAAGQTLEKEMVVGVGQAFVEAYLVEGQKVQDSSLLVRIFAAGYQADDPSEPVSREYGTGRGHDLPPGDYVAVATVGGAEAELPFSVQSGEQTSVRIVFNAGELTASAPGRTAIVVYQVSGDAGSRRKEVAYQFGDKLRTALPAGDYVVVSQTADEKSKEVPVTVRAGAKVEIIVP
jgi:Ca-activated chloride channel homolog